MRDVRWEVAPDAGPADRRAAEVLGEWLSTEGFRLMRNRPRILSRGGTAHVQFGWGAGRPDIRVVTQAPLRGRKGVARLTVVPDPTLRRVLEEQGVSGPTTEVPYPIPDPFFDWSDMGPVFTVTRHHHLQARPRLVVEGNWGLGHALTRVLPAARRALSRGGELALLDALADRARVAPAVAAMGLQEAVVFLPPLSSTELAGLFHSADLFLQADVHQGYPSLMRWALASGLPALGIDDPLTRRACEQTFVAVDPARNNVWPQAIGAVLESGRLREEIMRRAQHLTASRLSRVGPAFAAVVEALRASSRTGKPRALPASPAEGPY